METVKQKLGFGVFRPLLLPFVEAFYMAEERASRQQLSAS